MNISKQPLKIMNMDNLHIHSFSYPQEIHKIVFCDFDETYYPSHYGNRKDSGINELEEFVNKNCYERSFIIGWVTGSNLDSLFKKASGYLTYYPHFIGCSLGTELYWTHDNSVTTSTEWNKRISESGFKKENINHIVNKLSTEKNIVLTKQAEDYQGNYLGSYYYNITENELTDINIIKDYASNLNIKTSISKCNPATGDPENSYDINFIPTCCGKKEIVTFVCEHMNVDTENTWAFGDSFNDLEMLGCVNNSFLVANTDSCAKQHFSRVLHNKYCAGIMEGIEQI